MIDAIGKAITALQTIARVDKSESLQRIADAATAELAALKEENARLREALEAIVAKQKDDSIFRLPINCEAMVKVRAALLGKPA